MPIVVTFPSGRLNGHSGAQSTVNIAGAVLVAGHLVEIYPKNGVSHSYHDGHWEGTVGAAKADGTYDVTVSCLREAQDSANCCWLCRIFGLAVGWQFRRKVRDGGTDTLTVTVVNPTNTGDGTANVDVP